MHFVPEAVPAELPALLRRFVDITGRKPWQKRFDSFRQQIQRNPLIENHFLEKYPLELEMEAAWALLESGGCFELPKSTAQAALYSFVAMTARVHQRLSQAGSHRLAGMIRSSLSEPCGFAPLQYEMTMAANLMHRGLDVEFYDIEHGGGPDFLAIRDGLEVEVELKTVSGDVGRKVHRPRLYQLAEHLYPAMNTALSRETDGHLVRVILPDRLDGSDAQMQDLRDQIAEVLMAHSSKPGIEPFEIDYMTFALEGGPFERPSFGPWTGVGVREFVKELVGNDNENILMVVSPGRTAVVVTVESRKNDSVMKSIQRTIKDAAKRQLTGTRPGVILVNLNDVTDGELLELAKADHSGDPTALQIATSQLLHRADWRHVHTLAYSVPGHVVQSSEPSSDSILLSSVQQMGSTYVFKNPTHPLVRDPRMSLF